MSKKVHGISTLPLSTLFSKPSRLASIHPCFNVKAFPWSSIPEGLDPEEDYRATFITGKKKLGKSAVYRNKAERRVKTSVSQIFPRLASKGHDYIFYLSPPAVVAKWEDVQAQVTEAAVKLKSKSKHTTKISPPPSSSHPVSKLLNPTHRKRKQ